MQRMPLAVALHHQQAVFLVQFRHQIGAEADTTDRQDQAGVIIESVEIFLMAATDVDGADIGIFRVGAERRLRLGVEADPHEAGLFGHRKGIGLVDRREFLLILHVRDFFEPPRLAVIAPAMIAALDLAIVPDAAERQRRATMRAAILQRAGDTLIVAPQHDRLIADVDGQGLLRGHFLGPCDSPPKIRIETHSAIHSPFD